MNGFPKVLEWTLLDGRTFPTTPYDRPGDVEVVDGKVTKNELPDRETIYFVVRIVEGVRTEIYIGEAQDVQKRFPQHWQEDEGKRGKCFDDNNWNTVCVCKEDFSDLAARRRHEADLITKYKPECNDQL